MVESFVKDGTRLTEETLRDLHRPLTQGILRDESGFYRRVPVYIRGSLHVPPNWIKVPDAMQRFVDQYGDRPATEHPVRWAARAHIDMAGIHPFIDGNGRTSRLLVNWLLMREGWPPALYTSGDRHEYLTALEDAQFMLHRYLTMAQQVKEG